MPCDKYLNQTYPPLLLWKFPNCQAHASVCIPAAMLLPSLPYAVKLMLPTCVQLYWKSGNNPHTCLSKCGLQTIKFGKWHLWWDMFVPSKIIISSTSSTTMSMMRRWMPCHVSTCTRAILYSSLPETAGLPCAQGFALCANSGTRQTCPLPCASRTSTWQTFGTRQTWCLPCAGTKNSRQNLNPR